MSDVAIGPRRRRPYCGVCVGGPWAGKQHVDVRPAFNLPIMPPLSMLGPESHTRPDEVVKMGTYRWRPSVAGDLWQWEPPQ